MINLPEVTLVAMAYNPSGFHLKQTCRAINYTRGFINFKDAILFSYLTPSIPVNANVVQIPNLCYEGVQIFILSLYAKMLGSGLAMTVQFDGFPINPKLWSPEFLFYDFIGAPWGDGLVGNSGFCIHSDKYRQACSKLPFIRGFDDVGADWYPNHVHRDAMIQAGVRFAPTDVAARFSTESTHKDQPSFGFHGSMYSSTKCDYGWTRIELFERGLEIWPQT